VERDGFSLASACRVGVVALDEGLEDEAPPRALLDRLGIELSVEGPVPPLDAPDSDEVEAARRRLGGVLVGEDAVSALVGTAWQLGVGSLRAALLAVRCARASAALGGRDEVGADDVSVAARLVLAPRATQVPAPPDAPEQPPQDPPPAAQDQQEAGRDKQDGPLEDRVLAAAKAALPGNLLAALAAGARLRARQGGASGAKQKAAARGRPIGSRPGALRGGARLHVLATLRAAAPWQKVRAPAAGRVAIERGDFRIRRFKQLSRTTTIFVVDASGSAALQRLAEAKGAVELLLAECYVRRDRVALLSVRGRGAELLLPPTPSLARAKKCLAALPGGGGTPLAAGFAAALALAGAVVREGQTPLAVFLTDGRANIALSGAPGRPGAEADALAAACAWRAAGHASILVDTAPRPHPFARKLAEAAAARYLPLPSADSGALRAAVKGVGQ
jgi:magnesium chelatase subunit D